MVETYLSNQPIKRVFLPNDPFFEDGNRECTYHDKTVDEDIDFIIDSLGSIQIDEFVCSVKGCLQKFTSPLQFNRHFDMLHRFRCENCNRNFPSNYLLGLHLQENHDTFFQVQKEKGLAVLECILESCREKFNSDEQRRKHLVNIHKYPRDFRFNAVKRTHKKYATNKKKDENQQENKKNNTRTKNEKANIFKSSIMNPLLDENGDTAQNMDNVPDKTGTHLEIGTRSSENKQLGTNEPIEELMKCNEDDQLNTIDPIEKEMKDVQKKKRKPRKKKTTAKNLMEIVTEPSEIKQINESEHIEQNAVSEQTKLDDVMVSDSSMTSPKKLEFKRKLPKSISFGRGVQRGFSRTSHK